MPNRIRPPLDGSINIAHIRAAFLDPLGLLTGVPIKSKNLIKPDKFSLNADGKPKHLYQVNILSPLYDTETVKFKELIEEYGGQTPARLMGRLLLSDVYSQGMDIIIYGTDIQQTMFKKIRRLQEMLSGSGCPPIIPVVRKSPRFAPLSL